MQTPTAVTAINGAKRGGRLPLLRARCKYSSTVVASQAPSSSAPFAGRLCCESSSVGVRGCASRRENGFTLFTIPRRKNDTARRRKWIHSIGRKDFVPTKHTVLCELHFTYDQFEPLILEQYGRKKLKPNAVPTIFSHRSALPLPNKSAHLPASNVTSVVPAELPMPIEEDTSIHDTSGEQCIPEVPIEEDTSIHDTSGEHCIPDIPTVEEPEVHDSREQPSFPEGPQTATQPSVSSMATTEPPASDLEHASHQALLDRISELERLQEQSKRKLAASKRRYLKSEKEKEQLKSKIKHLSVMTK
ncbi:THAP domain-containing protein 3-like [Dermacentor silvarum]|uniref:THAP domain-containing protein 3-like n=1 Tax=Dermacentor silvarum TaxID=543639 RepID=UPI002100E18E|nr:THAP domain-containing protein 3-like [Dermacentor silvarum]